MARVDDYLAALAVAFANAGDIVPWPLPLTEIAPYYGDLEAADLYDRLRRLDAADGGDRVIGERFVGASSPKTLLMDLVVGLKAAGIPAAERLWFTERIFDAMTALEDGDIFSRDGAHRVLGPAAVARTVAEAAWVRLDGDAGDAYARAALAVSGTAQALVWAQLFYGWTDVGFEIHGPYRTERDGVPVQLVVRDFVDLRPVDLWPDAAALPHGRLRLLALHDAAADLAVDAFNHLTHTGALTDTVLAACLEVDGEPVAGAAGAEAVRKPLVSRLVEQHEAVAALDRPELVAKFVESRYYALRRWRTWFGDDWRPPAEVYARIAEWPPIEAPSGAGPPDGQDAGGLFLLFDPRSDVLPF